MQATRVAIALLIASVPAHYGLAQDEPADAPPTEVTIGEDGSEQDPLDGREPTVPAEAEADPEVRQVEGILGVPATTVQIDPRVLGVAPGEPLPPLRREGETLRKRDGRLLPSGDRGYAVFILDADPEAGDDQPLAMVVAPCITLESMEAMQEDRGEDLRFSITGLVHTYRGVNYLLPTSQPKPWLVKPEEEAGELANEPAEESEADPPDGDDVEPGNESGNQATPSADDVLEKLLNERTAAPDPVEPNNAEPAKGDVPKLVTDPLLIGLDPDQPPAELKDEGELLIARTGRLIRSADGSQPLFVLDSDGSGKPEAPMIMHACKLLETMEATVKEQGDDVPFVVTGQVFVYRGANYLLPTIVKREFDRGNLE